jgi:hypothetical protein
MRYTITQRPQRPNFDNSVRGASERQLSYASDLLTARDLNAETRPLYRTRLESLAREAAAGRLGVEVTSAAAVSALIEALLALPKLTSAPADSSTLPSIDVVPAGRYALDTQEGATNETAFYKVDRPAEGRWAGYTFVKLMVSDDEQRMSRAAGDAIVRKIAKVGAEAASARYGHEIGACGICGRTLTNDASRERGIGPICADKAGW